MFTYIISNNIDMKTEDLKTYASLTGKRIIENFACSYMQFGFFDNGNVNYIFAKSDNYNIGIELKPNVWYWWYSLNVDGYNDEFLFFQERYNQNNGASQKTFHKGYEAEQLILKHLLPMEISKDE